jgi:hypothetical protein
MWQRDGTHGLADREDGTKLIAAQADLCLHRRQDGPPSVIRIAGCLTEAVENSVCGSELPLLRPV